MGKNWAKSVVGTNPIKEEIKAAKKMDPKDHSIFNPNLQRSDIVPWGIDPETGKGELATPRIIYDAAKLAELPNRAWKGERINTDDITNFAATFALPAARSIGSSTTRQVVKRTPRRAARKAPTTNKVKEAETKLYAEVDNTQAVASARSFSDLISKMSAVLHKEGMRDGLTPTSASAFKEISKYSGKDMPLSEVAIARRMAKIAKNSTDPNEARLGGIMVRHLNDYLKGLELSPGAIIKGSAKGIGGKLNKADRMWQQQKNSEAIEKVIAKAEDSGGNFANALKTGIRGLLRKDIDAGGRLYTIEEKAALRKVLNGTITSKTVSSLRRLVPTSIGSFGPSAMAGYAGSSMLGPWTLPVQAAIGAAAIPATNAMARNAVNAARAVAVGAGRGTKATAGGRSSQITPKMGPLPATRMSHGLGRAGLGQALLNMQQSQALPPEVPLAAGGTEDDLRKQQRINWLKKSGQPWT